MYVYYSLTYINYNVGNINYESYKMHANEVIGLYNVKLKKLWLNGHIKNV